MSEGTLSLAFDPAILVYRVAVGNGVTRITFTAEAVAGAQLVYNKVDVDSSTPGHQLDLTVGNNFLSIIVSSSSPQLLNTYQVTVTRASSHA